MPAATDPDAMLRSSFEELQLKTQSLIDAWGLGSHRWDVDLDQGLIWFSSPGILVTGRVQIIGSRWSEDSSWIWAWDHPSVPEPLGLDALLVRDFGERHMLSRYTTRDIRCTEDEAWQFTALACHLAGAAGAYRGPSESEEGGETAIFMTLHDITIERTA